MMEVLLFLIFAVVFAMGFNYAMPRFTTFVGKYPKLAAHQSSFYGQTAITAVLVFALLILVAFIFAAAGEKPRVPGVAGATV